MALFCSDNRSGSGASLCEKRVALARVRFHRRWIRPASTMMLAGILGVGGCVVSAGASAAPTASSPSPVGGAAPEISTPAAGSPPAGATAGTPPATQTHDSLPPAVSPEEARIGKEGFKEVEQQYDLVKDVQTLAKMQSMIRTLEKVSPYPDLQYTVNIVKAKHPEPEPEINAFSLPGGYIFVTKDLIADVQSDDELAAVLAHEMSHDIHHHVLRQIKQRQHDTMISLLPVIAALLASGIHPTEANTEGAADIAMMSQEVVQALQSPHSIHDETEADMSGLEYMYKSKKYNPVGMLTFMERLAREERSRPEFDLGYLQTHPSSAHRVQDIRDRLTALHVPINPRAVTHALMAVAVPASSSSLATLRMQKLDITTFSVADQGQSPIARARNAAKAINDALDRGEMAAELDVRDTSQGAAVVWGLRPILTLVAGDAAAAHESPDTAAWNAVKNIRQAIWADELSRE